MTTNPKIILTSRSFWRQDHFDDNFGAKEAGGDPEGDPELGSTRKRVTEKGKPESLSRAAKRQKTREAMKAAAAAEEAKEADGAGYCVQPRGKHRAEGGVIATGDERTCLPDAMSVIYCMLFSIALTPTLTSKTIAWFSEWDTVHGQTLRCEGLPDSLYSGDRHPTRVNGSFNIRTRQGGCEQVGHGAQTDATMWRVAG
jgi:hypothetical protein